MDEENRGRVRRIGLIALCALSAFAAVWLWKGGFFRRLSSLDELRAMIGAAGPWAGVVYFVLQMLTVIIAPVPSNVTMLAGALAMGFFRAMLLGVLAVITGSILIFQAARRLGQRAVRGFLDRGVMDKYLPVIQEKQEMFLFLTMLFPFFPDDVLCILAGLTEMSFSRFVLIMVLARPWGLAFAALLGSGVIHLPLWGWAILVLVMAAFFCLSLRYSTVIEDRLLGFIRRITGRKKEKNNDDSCAVSQSGD